MNILDKIAKVPATFYRVASIIVILILVFLAFWGNINKFDELKLKSFSHLESAQNINMELLNTQHSAKLSKEQITILNLKINGLEEYKKHHMSILVNLYRNNYSLLTLFPILSAFTAIFAFLLLQKGWNSTNDYIKSHFILFSTLTALAGVYPDVYQQEDSIDKNLKSYENFKRLQKTIFNYALTAPVLDGDSILFPVMLDKINQREKELEKIHFGLEKKSVDTEIFNQK